MSLLDTSRIVELRKARGWDQKRLAQQINVSPSVISRLEKGQQKDFHFSLIVAVSKALGVSVDSLLLQQQEAVAANLIPELQAAIIKLSVQPREIQRHTAGMIEGYLSTLEN